MPPTCPASWGRSWAKSGRDLAKPRDVCLECLCFRVLATMGEVLTEWVASGVPALGAFNGIGIKLDVLSYQHPPKSLQNPIFWEDVPKMLPKRAQDGSQGAPDVDFWMIFEGFGSVFSSFSAIRINSLDQHSRYHMYLLSDAIT